MSRFLSAETANLAPYVPGEQPQDKLYIKLNTNECPYPPAPGVFQVLKQFGASELRLYPDPEALSLRQVMADAYGLTDRKSTRLNSSH